MTIGAYQIAFDAGPSYSTRREEAKAGMAELIRALPQIAPVILDLYAKAQDWPMASEIAERLQTILPPPVRAMIELEKARAEGRPLPTGAMPPAGIAPADGPPGMVRPLGMPPGAMAMSSGLTPPGVVPPAAMPPAGVMPPMPPAPPGAMPGMMQTSAPPDPVQFAGLEAEITKAQAAAQTARINVETKAIERDIRALELRAAAAKAEESGGTSSAVVQELAKEVAHLHGVVAEIAAVVAAQQAGADRMRAQVNPVPSAG